MMRRLRETTRTDDRGFTLIELLVAMVLVGVVSIIAITTLTTVQRSSSVTMAEHDGVEEARLALNRMTRELRQAREIVRVVNPDGAGIYDPNAVTGVTFKADFDDDGCIDGADPAPNDVDGCLPDDPSDPELLSYCHQPATASEPEPQLFIIRGALPVSGCAGGEPILAEDVAAFRIDYTSNLYRFDSSSAADVGVITWREIDSAAAPWGNSNNSLDGAELAAITSVSIELRLQNPGLELRTQVALRNRV